MIISDLPPDLPIDEVRTYCSVEAAIHYEIPADLVYAVARTEGGKPDTVSKNKNGSYDLGMMQFNTAYIRTLRDEGITRDDVMKSGCYPFHLAAWRLKGHLEEEGADVFTKVAYYNSRTPIHNRAYRQKVIENIKYFNREMAAVYYDLIMERVNTLTAPPPVSDEEEIEHTVPRITSSETEARSVSETTGAEALLSREMVLINSN